MLGFRRVVAACQGGAALSRLACLESMLLSDTTIAGRRVTDIGMPVIPAGGFGRPLVAIGV